MNYALIILGATSVIATLVALIFYEQRKVAVSEQKAAQDETQRVIEFYVSRLDLEQDKRIRSEQFLNSLKAELQRAEEDLAACSTPSAVRARLNRLFT